MKKISLNWVSGLLAILFLFTFVAIPNSAFASTKGGTKSGDFFYAFDIFFEKVDLAFTFNKEKRVQKIITNTEERLAEVEDAATEGKSDAVEKAMSGYQQGVSSAIAEAKKIEDKEKTKELLSDISDSVLKQQDILTAVYETVPEASKESVKKAIAISALEQEKATEEIVSIQADISSVKVDEALKIQKETKKIIITQNQEKDTEKKKIETMSKPTSVSSSSKTLNKGDEVESGIVVLRSRLATPATPAIPAKPATTTTPAIPAIPAIPAKPNKSSSSVSSRSSSNSSASSHSSTDSSSSISSSLSSSSSSSVGSSSSISSSASSSSSSSSVVSSSSSSTPAPVCYPSSCQLINDSSPQTAPRISGSNIIWQDSNKLSYINFITREQRIIANSPVGVHEIDGNKVVYSMDSQIYLYDINTSVNTQITHISDGTGAGFPSVNGNYISWSQSSLSGSHSIFLYNIATRETKQITGEGSNGQTGSFMRPVVYDDKIVYEKINNNIQNISDVYLYNIPTDTASKIGTGYSPRIYGDYVLWYGSNSNPITLYQISNQTQKNIGEGSYVRIQGDKVVYWSSSDRKLHVYIISLDQMISDFGNDRGDGGGWTDPDIYGNTVVFGGNIGIYYVMLP